MVKVGIIGAGNMGRMHTDAYAFVKNAKVIAVSDVRFDKASELAEIHNAKVYKNAEDLIAEAGVDMVDICLPTPYHASITIMAARKGVHVLCEKPIAISIEDASAMINASKEYDVKLMIGHCLRFSAAYNFLKDTIDSNKYGKLISLNLHRHTAMPEWSAGNWLHDNKQSGGIGLDLHIHDTDMVLYLLGKPQAVISCGSLINISTFYKYPDITVYAEGSWRPQHKFDFSMGYDAVFEGASILYRNNKIIVYEGDKEPYELIEEENKAESFYKIENLSNKVLYLYINEIEYFIDCIKNNKKPLVSLPEDSRQSMQIALAEIESLTENSKLMYL